MSVYGQEKPTDWDARGERRIVAPAGWKMSGKQMICANPNCGYRGAAATRSKGSRVVLWLLLAMFVLPGLIYAMLFAGQSYCCPQCRTVVNLA